MSCVWKKLRKRARRKFRFLHDGCQPALACLLCSLCVMCAHIGRLLFYVENCKITLKKMKKESHFDELWNILYYNNEAWFRVLITTNGWTVLAWPTIIHQRKKSGGRFARWWAHAWDHDGIWFHLDEIGLDDWIGWMRLDRMVKGNDKKKKKKNKNKKRSIAYVMSLNEVQEGFQ